MVLAPGPDTAEFVRVGDNATDMVQIKFATMYFTFQKMKQAAHNYAGQELRSHLRTRNRVAALRSKVDHSAEGMNSLEWNPNKYITRDNGIRIFYGLDGSGPPVFLLHGHTLDGSVWARAGYVADLQADYRLVIVDLRGHGRSDKPHDPEAYRGEAFATDILSIADAEVFERFGIWGWSQGSIVGWATAQRAPERVAAFIGTGGPTPRPWTVQEWADFDRTLLEPLRAEGMVGFLKAVEAQEPDPIEMRDLMLRADPDVVLANFAKDLLTTDGFTPAEDFPVPVLLIVGEHEDQDGDAERIAATVPNGRSLRLPGLGHAGAFSRSDLVLPTALDFLRETLPKPDRRS